jgi:hypothetical protein
MTGRCACFVQTLLASRDVAHSAKRDGEAQIKQLYREPSHDYGESKVERGDQDIRGLTHPFA